MKLYSRMFVTIFILSLSFFTIIAFADELSTRNKIKIRKKTSIQRSTPDDSQEYSLEKMELLDKKREALMEDIRKFLREARQEDQKAELNLRLGALYMEDYHAKLMKAQQVFDKELAAFEKNGKKGKEPQLSNVEATSSLNKATQLYRDMLNRYPKHPRRDEVYYFLAISSIDRGKIEEGISYFKKLSEDTPYSRYINDALVQLGDYYFDKNQFVQAEKYYDQIIARKYKGLIPYSTYKKAWCAYNQTNPKKALDLLKWVITNEENYVENSQSRVKQEALKDIALPFVDLKMVEEAINFFKDQGDPYTRKGIETMASLYFEQGEYNNAIKFYETLLAMDANHIKAPQYEISIIESYKLGHRENVANNRLFTNIATYAENSNWYEINAANPKAVKEGMKSFEELLWKYAVQSHAEAQRTKNTDLYATARKLYEKYLEFYPNSSIAPKARFQLAEILYKQALYAEAAQQYYQVYKLPTTAELKFDGIKSALMSLDRDLNLKRKKLGLSEINSKNTSKLKDSEDDVSTLPFTDSETKFIQIGEEFMTQYPKAKEAADILYESSYLQYVHHDFKNAYRNFWTLLQKYPTHETNYSSAYLALDILNRIKDYSKLVLACRKFLDTSSLSKNTFRTDVADIMRKAELKKIQSLEEKNEFKKAADLYVEYTKAYGHQDEALFEKALYNASIDYAKAEEFITAVETQEKFLRRFPKSTLRENMLLQVAKSYELLANYEKAANYFEQFHNQFPNNVQAKNAFRLAGFYYWGAGQPQKSEQIFISYMRQYPGDKQLVEKDLLDLYESEGAHDKLARYYLDARAQRGVSYGDYIHLSMKIAEIQVVKSGRASPQILEEALKAAKRLKTEAKQTADGVEALSKLHFWTASQKENAFFRLKLVLPQRQLEINLQRKLAILKELEKDYGQIVSLGSSDWGLASMYRISNLYQALSQEIKEAPVPSELSAEQVDIYRSEIEKAFIKPFKEKSYAAAVQCLDKAQEFNVLSNWTSKCYQAASEIDAKRYPILRTFYLPPVQVSIQAPFVSKTKMEIGNLKTYAYPFFSFALFNQAPSRQTASVSLSLYSEVQNSPENQIYSPIGVTYQTLAQERQDILANATNAERPADLKKGGSFAYLNLMVQTNPQKAKNLILDAIQREPQNISLHQLLGVNYITLKNYAAAKVTFLALIARGVKSAALWNNLGVLAYLEGRENQALEYFHEAMLLEENRETLNNLGFIALKFRNGFEAKKYFERSLKLERNEVTAQGGYAAALLQNREIEAGKEVLLELNRKYKNDPYTKLSLGYYLMDMEHELDVARRLLADYVDAKALDSDPQFRRAIQEAKQQLNGGQELPSLQ